jgi:hypothetical protein
MKRTNSHLIRDPEVRKNLANLIRSVRRMSNGMETRAFLRIVTNGISSGVDYIQRNA